MNPLTRLLSDTRGEMEEAAFVYPILLLLTFGLVNLAMVGFAGMNAANAANYGARMGSVAQSSPANVATKAASQMIAAAPVGTYNVKVAGGGTPGALLRVQVRYRVPNTFAGIASFFGVTLPESFTGTATSIFRQEGW